MSSYFSSPRSRQEVLPKQESSWSPWQDITSSPPYLFLVGPNKKTFYLHPSVIYAFSTHLRKLADDDWTGERSRTIALEDAREDTFARVVEYIYTGDYTPAGHILVAELPDWVRDYDSSSEVQSTPPTTIDGDETRPDNNAEVSSNEEDPGAARTASLPQKAKTKMSKKKTSKKKSQAASLQLEAVFDDEPGSEADGYLTLRPREQSIEEEAAKSSNDSAPMVSEADVEARIWTAFTNRKYEVYRWPAPFVARANTAPNEQYNLEFLTHARIFVCASAWQVHGLAALAIQRLHETLTRFTLYDERVGDVATLFEYAYGKDCAGVIGSSELQGLVIHYAACNVDKMVNDPCFQAVLSAENTASVDLVRKLVEYMIPPCHRYPGSHYSSTARQLQTLVDPIVNLLFHRSLSFLRSNHFLLP